MITPSEIEKKEFSKARKGFDPEEVDEFLDRIIVDMGKLLRENEELRKEKNQLAENLAEFKKSESSVIGTLESAKKLMNDISESAEKRAQVIIRNAQLDAEAITRDAKDSISSLTDEGARLKEKVLGYKQKYRQMLSDELARMDGLNTDWIHDLDKDFLPASMDSRAATDVEPVEKKEDIKETDKSTVILNKSVEEMIMEDMAASSVDEKAKTRVF